VVGRRSSGPRRCAPPTGRRGLVGRPSPAGSHPSSSMASPGMPGLGRRVLRATRHQTTPRRTAPPLRSCSRAQRRSARARQKVEPRLIRHISIVAPLVTCECFWAALADKATRARSSIPPLDRRSWFARVAREVSPPQSGEHPPERPLRALTSRDVARPARRQRTIPQARNHRLTPPARGAHWSWPVPMQ
jgi:hypothetical protein